jgi:DME family drug/metabolite transporter
VGELARTRTSVDRAEIVVIAAVIGLVLVSSSAEHGDAGSGDRALGLGMATCSGVLYAVTTVLSMRTAGRVRPLALTTASTAIGAAFLFPIAASTGSVVTSDTTSFLALAYLGVVTMTPGYLLLYSGLRTAPASAAVVATLIEPATATELAFLVLGDRLTVPAMIDVILILVSIGVLHLVSGSRAGPARGDEGTLGPVMFQRIHKPAAHEPDMLHWLAPRDPH